MPYVELHQYRVGHHHHLPRCSTVGDHIHRAIHHAAQCICIVLRHLKFGEAPVVHIGIGESHPKSIGEIERECPLHGLGKRSDRGVREGRLCPALGPGLRARGEAILGEVVHHLMEDGLLVFGQEVAEGDALIVPEYTNIIKISGEVMYPVSMSYEKGRNLAYYIQHAGGYSSNASKRKVYGINANGSVVKLGSNSVKAIEPGMEIVVPQKNAKKKLSTTEIIGIGSGIAALASVIVALLNAIK